MDLPSSTAATMLEKLSSARTMSAASLATSVPAMPMAMPMSACFRAGASFTPSPVMAAISPSCFKIFTIICLWRGSVRENTAPSVPRLATILLSRASFSFSGRSSNSFPVKEQPSWLPPLDRIPRFLEIASAVSLLSPVIMITLMPAWPQAAMADLHSGRGGSRIPTSPRNVMLLSNLTKLAGSASSAWSGCDGPLYVLSSVRLSRMAKPMVRRALVAMPWISAVIAVRQASVRSLTVPSGSIILEHLVSITSEAPLT
mmetsp:Transcript_18815/g.49881  ORF Transcript_18815/g.49881 Transcript_18815/m.49881 type:complete len:258 (-) Transcript_18815:1472-2245(-)